MDWLAHFIVCLLYEAALEADGTAWRIHGDAINVIGDEAFWSGRALEGYDDN